MESSNAGSTSDLGLWPNVIEVHFTAPLELKIVFTLDKADPIFEAHFVNDPLVPGAFLLIWVERFIKEYFSSHQINQVERVKFIKPVRAEEELCLTLKLVKERCIFEYQDKSDTVLCSGQISISSLLPSI